MTNGSENKLIWLKENRIVKIFVLVVAFFLMSYLSSCHSSLPWFLGVFDLAKGISWPLALTFIAFLFRDEIGGLLERVREAGPTQGVKFDAKQPPQPQKDVAAEVQRTRQDPAKILGNQEGAADGTTIPAGESPADQSHNLDGGPNSGTPKLPQDIKLNDLPGVSRTAEQINLERLLHLGLKTHSILPELHVDFLIHLLAKSQLSIEFEKIYRSIYGSQLKGLRRLHERKEVSLSEAREFFHSVVVENADFYTESSFVPWLDFLIRAGLIRQFESLTSNDGPHLRVTAFGEDFLRYIFECRYNEDLPR
ncbi:MAG: hypothetical protein ACK53U_18745 [Alphaproteobacteria bacterium]|jgi:hypothetical protein